MPAMTALRSMPGAGRSIEPFGNIAPAVKHGMVNGVVVRGMGSGLPEPLVCERALVEIKDQKRRAKRWHIPRPAATFSQR